ncbi:MAG: Zn-ribbon domain-containing OB-fold protein [Actinobacteria bacterium]|nr:Zn-ribbon domain-containing OB-fold protein [Actinomycetota bacterium]MBU1945032.1 Zn-ribbon domain-containing OB-fold protein [Actinomycetota bacterium]MBU2686632.1 Zn-ribbon domain-containing OB-fold protein [Actinomycetota bacterium]
MEEHISTSGTWPLSAFRWKTERFMDRYVEAFRERKILGIKCANCGTVYSPPALICVKCTTELRLERDEDWIRMSERGTVLSYTVAYTGVAPGGLKDLSEDERAIYVLLQLDGADTHMLAQLEGAGEDEVRVGMRVQAAWASETKGALSDLAHFVPAR